MNRSEGIESFIFENSVLDCIRRRQAAKRIKVNEVVHSIESCKLALL